jgi:hypothetical protein
MKTTDDYKMVLHNSAIVINNCNWEDYPTLTNKFSNWDPLRFKKDYIGIYYDKQSRRLFLPRGIDVDYVKRKISSNMELEEFTSTVVHNYDFAYNQKPIKMKMGPRDQVQIEALNFVLCKDKYYMNSGKSQFALNLFTGKGKTFVISAAISYLGIRTIVITAQTGILDQWIERIKEYTTIDDSEIVKIEGGPMITRILDNKSTVLDKSLYLCTHSTLQTYANTHGWDSIGELFKKLKIGIKVFDEAHQNFLNMSLIDFAARDVWRTYYVTATPSRSDSTENKIYKLYMKNVPSIDLFNPEIDAHTKYIAIKYNSYPKPSDITKCKTSIYGISNPLYIEYLMRNERFWIMFDYIFSLIYRSGGRALFYIGTNNAILKVKQRILFNYPELQYDIGIYTSISENKQEEKNKKYILTTTKSAGAGEDIPHLKYSVVLAEPFKSEVLARQTLGRTRDNDTIYIELVDVGFKQLIAYYNAKKSVFTKYASECKNMNVDNLTLYNLQEETRINIKDRFKNALEMNVVGPQEGFIITGEKMIQGIYFGTQQN